jgi:DNA-binding NtrC family response regulator
MVDDLRSGTWVTYVDGQAASLFVRKCRLQVVSGPDCGGPKEYETSVLRIGARRGCDLELSDSKVSGLHCEIRLDERGYRLRDMESTNGTWVGGYRVQDIYVSPGTVIQVGASKIKFEPLGDGVEMPLAQADRFGGMVGRSVKMRELFARLERIATTDATVLITGETGTGKELVAEAVHEHSPRASGPFVVLDCGAIPPNLVESELFGHERGAFTGATSSYIGAFERADGGTVFLDEIGELPLDLQPKLLRVLERKEVRKIGGSKTITVDIRVVAATNRDLGVEVNKGRFREDLYYRLAVARVHVPALRERREDIPLLVEHFLQTLPGGDRTKLRPETLELMKKHEWPGNVRELRNVIERAVLLSEAPGSEHALRRSYLPSTSDRRGPAIERGSLPPQMLAGQAPPPVPAPGELGQAGQGQPSGTLTVAVDTTIPFKLAKQDLVEEFERRYIRALLEEHGGNISAAARAAGIDRMSIHKILHRLGLDNPRGSGSGSLGGTGS